MRLLYRNISAQDLRGSTHADFLIHIEAAFEIIDDYETVYPEALFPVAKLARDLVQWLSLGNSKASDFYFSSLSFEEPGSVVVLRGPDGWTVGSLFTPETSSSPMSWPELAARLGDFISPVRADIGRLGLDHDFILS